MSTKQRMIEATIESLRRHGLAGTSFTDVLAASGAARGAIYHHFPGGKTELAEAAVQRNGADVEARLRALPVQTSAAEVVDAFLALARPVVEESATGSGCAVAAVATEAEARSRLQIASRVAFSAWREALTEQLVAAGAEDATAAQLATLLITTLEGAHVLCRAEGSIAPFDEATAALRRLA